MKLVTIVGARPQFIKAAAVSRALAAHGGIAESLVHTGQHYDADMSDVFFDELSLPAPARHLGIHGGGHGAMVGKMLEALEPVLEEGKPDAVLVYGDTNSTLAGALAAAKLGLPLAHVEAGLRSFNRRMPEEVNRLVADRLAALLLCPTTASVVNLAREGIVTGVHQIGDVMYDATLFAAEEARRRSRVLEKFDLSPGLYAVATVHRAENTESREALARVAAYLAREAKTHPIVLPLHPRTKSAAERFGVAFEGVRVVPPLGYLDMHRLLQDAAVVHTDSGGVQKEAYFHRVPCVTMRNETEWVETIACGWNRLWSEPTYRERVPIADYGDGHAAKRAAELVARGFG